MNEVIPLNWRSWILTLTWYNFFPSPSSAPTQYCYLLGGGGGGVDSHSVELQSLNPNAEALEGDGTEFLLVQKCDVQRRNSKAALLDRALSQGGTGHNISSPLSSPLDNVTCIKGISNIITRYTGGADTAINNKP